MKFQSLLVLLIITGTFTFCKDVTTASNNEEESGKGKKKEKKKRDKDDVSSDVTIVSSWNLPDELKEVSGIAYLDDNRFACVQDEKGIIFIYNAGTKTIDKKIPFNGAGDYEAIAVIGNTAYVATGDGEIFEVNISGGNSATKKYNTPLTANHNVEGLCYDRKHNRLLLAIKDYEPGNKEYKGIYAFDLAGKSLIKDPVFKIQLKDKKLGKKAVMPSEIAIHPITNEIYITDGPNARLLIMNSAGEVSKLLELGKPFAQPEGITFSPEGEIFISNEGNKGPGNIIKVSIN